MKQIKNTKNIEILTPDGFKKFDGLQIQDKEVLKITFNNYSVPFICTPDHLINYDDSTDNFKAASEFIKGDLISHNELGYLTIKSVRKLKKRAVYDILEVNNNDSLYLSNGIKSHNCSFLGSNKSLLDGETIRNLIDSKGTPIEYKHNGKFRIFELPKQGFEYILGVDPADGVGGDSSSIQVLKITTQDQDKGLYYKLEQVAVYQSNMIKPKDFAQVVVGIGKWYNNGWVMAENNNSCGGLTCHFLWNEFSYSNMVNPDWRDKRQPGINSNKTSKYRANMMMKDIVDTRQIKIIDGATIDELSRYEEQGPDIYAAGNGAHDDLVTSLMWAISFLDTKWFSGYGENLGRDILEEFEIEPLTVINASKLAARNREKVDIYSDMLNNHYRKNRRI